MFYKPQVAAVLAIVLAIDLGLARHRGYAINRRRPLGAQLDRPPRHPHRLPPAPPTNVHSFQTGTAYPWEQHVTLKAFWAASCYKVIHLGTRPRR